MEDKKKPRRKSIQRLLALGEPIELPTSGFPLQEAFWKIWEVQNYSYPQWAALIREHISSPEYLKQFNDNKRTNANDRINRLMVALSGGSTREFPADLTWKRFIEGLAVMKMETLEIRVAAWRGNFDKEAWVQDSTKVRPDFLKNLRDENKRKRKEFFSKTATHEVNQYISNPAHTYTHVMKHPLLRIIYRLIERYNVSTENWERWSTNYVNNPKLCPATSSKRGDRRNNMKQAMRHTEAITWRWFLIILQAMDVRRLQITFKVSRKGELWYEGSVDIPLAEYRFWSSNETEQP